MRNLYYCYLIMLFLFCFSWCMNIQNSHIQEVYDLKGKEQKEFNIEKEKDAVNVNMVNTNYLSGEVVNEKPIIYITWDNHIWESVISRNWLIYRNEKYWFQISYDKERSWWKIFDLSENYNKNHKWSSNISSENNFLIATMPSPWNSWFEMIHQVSFLNYNEYDNLKRICNEPDSLCSPSVEEITIGNNDEYYIVMIQWFMRQFEELSQLFYPYLPLENITLDDGTDKWWTIQWSQYILDHPFLFSEYEIFNTKLHMK